MPPPVSYIDITSYPFSRVVTQAEFNAANEIWFRRVATIPEVIGVQTNSGGTFIPRTSFYDNAGTLIRNAATGISGQYYGFLTANTYYIKIVRSVGGASDFDFTFTADTSPLNSVIPDADDILVNDESDQHLTTIFDPTGAIRGYFSGIPAGETAAILPSNISVWHDRFNLYSLTNRIAVFDANFNYVTSVNCGLTGSNFPRFAVDFANDQFYVVNQFDELWTISNAGVATYTGYDFPSDSPIALAVSPDGSKIYWCSRHVGTIQVLTVSGFTPAADLYAVVGFTPSDDMCRTYNTHPGDLVCIQGDGSVIFWWYNNSTFVWKILHVSALGVLLSTKTLAGDEQIDHLAYIIGSTTQVYYWYYPTSYSLTSVIGKLTLSTGVVSSDFETPNYSEGIPLDNTVTDKFGQSTSCTLLIVQDSTPVTPTGTIQVVKATTPIGLTQSFEFTAGGGLVPSSFTLAGDGASQTFLLVPVGSGYSIEETEIDGYTTTYDVSNDSPIDDIEVAEDEVVIITVTNIANVTGGIYKITPGKRNDTIYNDGAGGTTTDVKIPDPFIDTGYIGD